MSEFAQRTVAGAASHRAAKKKSRQAARSTPAGQSAVEFLDGRRLYRATTSDGRSVLVSSRLRRDIIEEATRLAAER